MTSRMRIATAMAFRDQWRRPVVLILLVVVPAYVVTRSIAITQATPRGIELPGGSQITTTMRDLHGAVMAGTAIAFVAALVGVFVMQSALQGDRRLVVAGFRAGDAIAARLAVLIVATALVVAVAAIATALSFTPAAWSPLLAAYALTGLIYTAIGALVGVVLEKLAATYLILFVVMTDIGIVQNPMFGNGTPGRWAGLLPAYGPSRMMIDGAFSTGFHTSGPLLGAVAWLAILTLALNVVLRRSIGTRLRTAGGSASR